MTTRPDIARHRFADLIVASEFPLVELGSASPTESADVVIERSRESLREPERWFQVWTAGDGLVRFGRTPAGYLVEFPAWARVSIAPDASQVVVESAADASEFELKHMLLHQVLPLIVSRRGRLVVHASAVSWRDRVVAFVGRTGAGKSTLAAACASLGAAVVADDSLILSRSSSSWEALPSYPGIRLRPDGLGLLPRQRAGRPREELGKVLLLADDKSLAFEGRTLPLDGLFLLGAGTPCGRLPRVRGAAAAMALASQLFRLDVEDPDESRRMFRSVTDLAIEVPVWRVPPSDGPESLAAISRQLLEMVETAMTRHA